MEIFLYSLAFSAILFAAIKIYLRFLDEQLRDRSGTKYKVGDHDER